MIFVRSWVLIYDNVFV